MVMSNKILLRGHSLLKLVVSKRNRKKKQYNNHITDLKQTQRQIHNPMKHHNRSLLQKQTTA